MFNVAFSYTRITGGYEGVITWTSFRDEATFNDWYTEATQRRQQVVEKGISRERCIELVGQTPPICYLGAAFEESLRVLCRER